MEQMQIDPESRIEIDYQDWTVNAATKALQPVVFKQGDAYFCLLGPDPQVGIFGCGDTAFDAITDWEQNMQARVQNQPNDEVSRYVKQRLQIDPQ